MCSKLASCLMCSQFFKSCLEDYDFSNYRKRTFYVKGNSLVIAATNGFHRRLNEDKNGVRKFITFHYYFAFTRFDLLKNYIFHKFQKNNEG